MYEKIEGSLELQQRGKFFNPDTIIGCSSRLISCHYFVGYAFPVFAKSPLHDANVNNSIRDCQVQHVAFVLTVWLRDCEILPKWSVVFEINCLFLRGWVYFLCRRKEIVESQGNLKKLNTAERKWLLVFKFSTCHVISKWLWQRAH